MFYRESTTSEHWTVTTDVFVLFLKKKSTCTANAKIDSSGRFFFALVFVHFFQKQQKLSMKHARVMRIVLLFPRADRRHVTDTRVYVKMVTWPVKIEHLVWKVEFFLYIYYYKNPLHAFGLCRYFWIEKIYIFLYLSKYRKVYISFAFLRIKSYISYPTILSTFFSRIKHLSIKWHM